MPAARSQARAIPWLIPTRPPTTAIPSSRAIAPRSTRLDREILERLNARAAHAKSIGALKGARPRVPARARGAGAEGAARAAMRDRFRNDAVTVHLPRGHVGVPGAGTAGRSRRTSGPPAPFARGGDETVRPVRATPCPARRSTKSSAQRRAARPTTRSCRSRTRPKARSAARSTSCARRRCRSAARSGLRIRQNLLSKAAALDDGHARLFARAVAGAVRRLARAAPAGGAADRRREQRRGGAARRSGARRRRDRRARSPRRSTACRCLPRNIEDEPNNTTRFWVLGRQAVPPPATTRRRS